MSAQLSIPMVQDGDVLRVWLYKGQSDRLVVSFTGIGLDGADLGYEFANTATHGGRDSALFIADKTRSWLNAPGIIDDIRQWIDAARVETGAKVVMTLGHSMGGFAALAMPKYTPVKVAVGLSPQASVHPDVVPEETRWAEYRDRITAFTIRDLSETIVPDTTYYVLHGRHTREKHLRDRMPEATNIVHLILPRTVHNVPQKLRAAGKLGEVVEFAFQNRPRAFRLSLSDMEAYRRSDPDPFAKQVAG
ncbi:serine aminopeptidase domain-containing protein [Pseudooceanicola sp. MF1-13]|uniref:serine aminopeptidase domain-containing protein n=1 Tax=Pseudooceanicola sp. MF1-13 TaxID=3379095 RepID=UPI00389266F2